MDNGVVKAEGQGQVGGGGQRSGGWKASATVSTLKKMIKKEFKIGSGHRKNILWNSLT